VARVERTERRRDLFLNGLSLSVSQSVIKKRKRKPAKAVETALRKTAHAHNISPAKILTFDVRQPPQARSLPKGMVQKSLLPTRVHVIYAGSKTTEKKLKPKARATSIPQIEALVINEINGKIVSAVKTLSR
jgi:hypothetical protein